jgi:hypothetical protein
LESPLSYPSDRFAAALAHLLNSESSHLVRVEPGALYVRLIGLIARRYADSLLHHPSYASRMDTEEAASRYFDATLGRRLRLSGRVPLSVAHRLFAALCARGSVGPWRTSVVARRLSQALEVGDLGVLRTVRDKLATLSRDISPGSASPTLLARLGPIVLSAGGDALLVPEEMASWDAICCSPSPLVSLPPGEPFNRFCHIVIDCVRTANRPILELLSLGRRLCPFDWLAELSIQQVRALKGFLGHLQARGAPDTLENWRLALEERPVPGFKSVEQLWHSPIGAALRNGSTHPSVALDDAVDVAESEDELDLFLGAQEYQNQLRELLRDGLINEAERSLLLDVYAGVPLEELAERPAIRALLKVRGMTLEELLEDIRTRVERWHHEEPS